VRARHRALIVIACLAGCNEVFDLNRTHFAPDDDDGDGAKNGSDNCPGVYNPTQSDLDGDGYGDACDDCPLIPDAQDADQDGDGIGDACDPHPFAPGDCLLLLDGFTDPTTFAAGWDVVGPAPAFAPGAVVVQAGSSIIVHDPIDASVVEVSGNVEVKSSSVAATLQEGSPLPYFGCRLTDLDNCNPLIGVIASHEASGASLESNCGPLSADHVGDSFLLRLHISPVLGGNTGIDCRVDYGLAAAAQQTSSGLMVLQARPGVAVTRAPATIFAVAAYGVPSGTTCPPTVVR
jgi:hypothetical protein